MRGLNRTRASSIARTLSFNGDALIFNLKKRDRPDGSATRVRAGRVEQKDKVVYLAALVCVRGCVTPSGLDAPEERFKTRAQLFARSVKREVVVRADVARRAA